MNILIVGSLGTGKRTFTEVLLNEHLYLTRYFFASACVNSPIEFTYGETNSISLAIIPKNKNLEWLVKFIPSKGNLDIDSETIWITLPAKDFTYDYMCTLGCNGYSDNPDFEIGGIIFSVNNGFLKENKITIVDPINSCNTDLASFKRDCNASDLVIFITSTSCCCSRDESEVIELIPSNKLFIVVNRMDMIQSKEIDLIKEFIGSKWGDKSPYPINYISALQALDAIEDKNLDRYISSGMQNLCSNLRVNFRLLV